MLEQYEDVLSVEQLCDILKIGRNRAYELLSNETISGFRLGRNWRIPKIALEKYLKECAFPDQPDRCKTSRQKTQGRI